MYNNKDSTFQISNNSVEQSLCFGSSKFGHFEKYGFGSKELTLEMSSIFEVSYALTDGCDQSGNKIMPARLSVGNFMQSPQIV